MISCFFLMIIFFAICITFGFIVLKKLNKINSLLFLIPFSAPLGISSYVFICHLLSFLIGPKLSSLITLFVLSVLSAIIFLLVKDKESLHIQEISKKQFTFILLTSLLISFCTFLCLRRYVIFDEAWHIPLANSIYHNDVYPPRDFFRPDYSLAYHFGGDLLAGAISHILKTHILSSFELVSGLMSGITFFSFFILAYLLTKNFFLSSVSALCCYFGAGLIWLNEIFRYFTTGPQDSFLKSFLKRGIHGTIIDAPSIVSFSTTASIGYPVLILCLFLFWRMTHKNNTRLNISDIVSLLISLFALSLFAGWLSMTFLVSVIAYMVIFLLIKQKDFISEAIKILILLGAFYLLNVLIGNQMYSQDLFLGRANIFNFALKNPPFTVESWSGIVPIFSWKFISAFGLSLLLFPVIPIYLKKIKNNFALLLFLCAALTMPLPLILDFKLNPVDFNRLFGFGNTMLILLITCGLGELFPKFFQNKILISIYITLFCFSPFCGFVFGTVFSPRIYLDQKFSELTFNKFKRSASPERIFKVYIELNKEAYSKKYLFLNKYKNELLFFSKGGKPKDVAISSIPGIPIYSGVYTLIPSMLYGLKSQLYSGFDNIYPTIISTLDPQLLNELNIKWIGYDELSKSALPEETLAFLNNKEIFMLAYKNHIKPVSGKELLYEIYSIGDLSDYLKSPRKTGWILVNKDGFPIEITNAISSNISLFPSEKEALKYLKQLRLKNKKIKNLLITAQPILIMATQEQLAQSKSNIRLEERF